MPTPENPLDLPEETQIRYLDGLKDDRNSVCVIDFIVSLKDSWDFAGLAESIRRIALVTETAGLHAFDPNWYGWGGYQNGMLEPGLLYGFEEFLRMTGKLADDQMLTPFCYYTQTPRGNGLLESRERADLMICVQGGLFDHWGQFIMVHLVEGSLPFDLIRDADSIEAIRSKARSVGKQEMTAEELRLQLEEYRKKDKEIERYFEEQEARWAAESEEN